MNVTIEPIRVLVVSQLDEMLRETEVLGYRFLRRLTDEWHDGTNRVERHGEALFVAGAEGRLVGVCGLNQDPYAANPQTGRVRHLYVAQELRGRGVGGNLVRQVIHDARKGFELRRLSNHALHPPGRG